VVIEVDGLAYGAERTAFLEALGLRVFRFSNADVLKNLDGVELRLLQLLNVA
jgi:very-short-patch-repair endonuclease